MICLAAVVVLSCVVAALVLLYQWISRLRKIPDAYQLNLQPIHAHRAPPRGEAVFVQRPGGGGILGLRVDQ